MIKPMMKKVIIAEGTPKIRKALRLLLEESAGITVVGETAGLTDLFKILEKPDWLVDVVLLDWDLVVDDGNEAMNKIRKDRHHLPVIAIVGQKREGQQALSAGATAIVKKSETPEKILTAIRGLNNA